MALRVWLPLNGNLKNQGTDFLSVSGTPTYSNGGKIGKGLSLSPRITFTNLSRLDNFTICFWLKVDSCTSDWADSLGFTCKQADGTAAAQFRFEATQSTRACSFHNNSPFGITQASRILIEENQKGTWYHCCVSYNGAKLYTYVDGSLLYTDTGLGGYLITDFHIGENNNIITGVMNDLRIYDECLSPKQIHEISKGLIAHYKLEGIGANPNLLTYSNVPNRNYSSTTYPCGAYPLPEHVVSGEKYTVTVNATFTDAYVIALFFGGGSYGTQWADCSTNGTYDVSWTFTATSNMAAQSFVNVYVRDADNTPKMGVAKCVLNHIKLEKGEKSTDWVPNSGDAIYSKLGFDNMLLEDVSGNGYNLLNVDSTMTYNTSSPRYNTSIYRASATRSVGNIPPIFQNGQEINEITLSGWLKTNTTLGTNKNLICLGNNSFIRFGPTNNNTLWTYIRMGNTNKTLEVTSVNARDDIWHNYVVTFKNGVITAYMDGVQKGTADYSSTATTLSCQSTANYIGAYNSTSEIVLGSFSDIRIYATALSAADVKQLYDTAGIVDNANNEYVYEYNEKGSLLDYADYPGAQSNLTAVFTRTIVDDPEAPTGKAVKLECTTAGSGYYFNNAPWSTAKAKMENGKTYVVSMYVKTNASRSIKMNVECASSQSQTTWTVGTEYQHLVNTFVYSNTTQYSALTDYANFVVGDVIYIHSFKIEAVEDQPKLEKTGVMNTSTMDENNIAKIYKSKLEANDFIEI